MSVLVQDIAKPRSAWNVTMNPDDLYKNPMNIAWTFKYIMSGDKVEDLYKRAKQNQWDADELLPWDTPVDPSKPLINDRSDIYHRMPFFSKLSKSQQEMFTAHSTAQLLSQFLHGEQGALMTAACVTHSVPDATAKLYAATQTMDEARHVEVYARYCDKIAIVYPMSLWLKALIDATLKSDRYEKIMIGMNMIVEGLALRSKICCRKASAITSLTMMSLPVFGFLNFIHGPPSSERRRVCRDRSEQFQPFGNPHATHERTPLHRLAEPPA